MAALRVAVTGASGFIGRHVLKELLRVGCNEIVAAARCSERLAVQDGIRTVVMDIAQPAADAFGELGQPEILIHLAWGGLPNYRSLHHFASELPLQFRFLRQLVESGLDSLVVAGTCFEYGMQSGCLSEGLPTRPSNPYGYAKDALRKQLEFLQAERSFQLAWARLFYMYGEGQPRTSLYAQVQEAAMKGEKIFNMSGGEQLRDYLTVSEVARQIVALALHGRDAGIVNVCSGEPVSIRMLVERWMREKDWALALNLGHYPYPSYEPMAFWGDASRIQSIMTKLRMS